MKLYITVLLTVIGFVGYSQSSQQVTLSKLLEIQEKSIVEAEMIIYDLGFEYAPIRDEEGLDLYVYELFESRLSYYTIEKSVYVIFP